MLGALAVNSPFSLPVSAVSDSDFSKDFSLFTEFASTFALNIFRLSLPAENGAVSVNKAHKFWNGRACLKDLCAFSMFFRAIMVKMLERERARVREKEIIVIRESMDSI